MIATEQNTLPRQSRLFGSGSYEMCELPRCRATVTAKLVDLAGSRFDMQNRAVLQRLPHGGFDDGNVSGAHRICAASSRLAIGTQNFSQPGTSLLARVVRWRPPRATQRLFSAFHTLSPSRTFPLERRDPRGVKQSNTNGSSYNETSGDHRLRPTRATVERTKGADEDDRGFVHEGLFRCRVCVKLTEYARNNNKTK